MNRSNLELMECGHCRRPFELEELSGDECAVEEGWLHCLGCGIVVPVEQGFPFFTLANLERADARQLLGTPGEYTCYRELKFERGEIELYAAFQPFNESLRATEPLLPLLARDLAPGDVILEPWARTGWTAAWLASQFPNQRVIALWEGPTSVLGYRGFAHWFARDRCPPNLDVMFVHPERVLPFATASISAVFSHDCFHRFSIDSFGSEMLRVSKPEAPLVFAHVHLSNSQPDPWFDRGGTIRHGRSYRAWLDRITAGTSRQGRVWGEGDLFDGGAVPPDDPDTTHYNGLILIARDIDEPRSRGDAETAEQRLLLNPLYQLQSARSVARVDLAHLAGAVGYMIERHPVYRARLPERPLRLDDLDWLIIALACCGTAARDIAAAIDAQPDRVRERTDRLLSNEVLLAVSASAQMHDLQRFHANQLPPDDSFLDLNKIGAGASLTGKDFMLSGDEIATLLQMVGSALASLGAGRGSHVKIGESHEPLVLLIMLAAAALGSDVVVGADLDGLAVQRSSETRHVSFGWDSQPGGLIALIESTEPDALPTAVNGTIRFVSEDQSYRLQAGQFLEASCSLKHVLGRPHTANGFGHVADWIVATSGILAGFPVTID